MAYDLFGPVFPLYDYQTAHAWSPTWWRQIEIMIAASILRSSSSSQPAAQPPEVFESIRASLGWANQLIYSSGSLLYFISLRRNVARPSPNLTSYGQLEQEAAEALWWPMLRRFHRLTRIKACLIMRCVSIFLSTIYIWYKFSACQACWVKKPQVVPQLAITTMPSLKTLVFSVLCVALNLSACPLLAAHPSCQKILEKSTSENTTFRWDKVKYLLPAYE